MSKASTTRSVVLVFSFKEHSPYLVPELAR